MLLRKSLMKILREYHRLYREFMKNIFRKKCKLQGFGKTIKSVPYKYLICFGIIKKMCQAQNDFINDYKKIF